MPSAEYHALANDSMRKQREQSEDEAAKAHGTADWMKDNDPAWSELTDTQASFLAGRVASGERKGEIIRSVRGHATITAPTGTGKGKGFVIPQLLSYRGSALVLDPKGEAAAITAAHRAAMGQRVFILDPYELPGSRLKNNKFWRSYDPFSFPDPNSDVFLEDLYLISSAVIIDESGQGNGGFFSDEARTMSTAFALFMFHFYGPDGATFSEYLRLVYSSESKIKEYIEAMQGTDTFGGALAMLGNALSGYNDTMLRNVLSTIRRSLNMFVLSPKMVSAMKPSEVNFKHLKDGPMTIYVCLPVFRLETHSRWLRTILSIALRQNLDDRRPPHDLLVIADEAASLKKLDQLSEGISYLRGFGIRLTSIFQDISQLSGIYPQTWQTWIANSELIATFGNRDNTTCEYVSKMLGVATTKTQTEQIQRERLHGGNIATAGRPLLTPDEVARMPLDEQILLFSGKPPIRAKKLRHWCDPEFRRADGTPLFEENPYYKP